MKECAELMLHEELKLQKSIDDRLGRIVQIGEKLIDDLDDRHLEKIEGNQIRNVIAVANSAPHPAVVTNFIRYQMGRSGNPSRAWRETGLGDKVITQIEDTLKTLAADVFKEAPVSSADIVQVRLTSLMLGFMNRHFVYKTDVQKARTRRDQGQKERR